MTRPLPLLLTIAALVSCKDDGTPAAAYQNWKDRVVVAAGLSSVFWPCHVKEGETENVVAYTAVPDDQCYKMDAPRRWSGLWRNDFEGSQFCPAPARSCEYVPRKQRSEPQVWLASGRPPDQAVYAVEFVGRQTSYDGSYGHMGMSDKEIVVDRWISVKQVEAPAARRRG